LLTPSVDFTLQMNRLRQIASLVAEATNMMLLICHYLILLPSLFEFP